MRLSTRDVERLSQEIAAGKKNQEYYISHAWLNDIENGMFTPSVYKMYSLSLVYKRPLDEILGFFGIGICDIGKEQNSLRLPHTHLVEQNLESTASSLAIPLELRERVLLQQTNLVSRMFARWGSLPVALLQHMDLQKGVYGYIGSEDYTLHPLIRPGSFVEIDHRQTRIQGPNWQNEFDRPVYFVELRDTYVCSWCELDGKQLRLVPHPQSRTAVRQVRYPLDAEIVGRVTAVVMRIAEPINPPAKQPSSLF